MLAASYVRYKRKVWAFIVLGWGKGVSFKGELLAEKPDNSDCSDCSGRPDRSGKSEKSSWSDWAN